ncbi:MAG: cob(I)yrinic acid a,c-diamide adenosyltransferase [Pseudomonadota bacterium]
MASSLSDLSDTRHAEKMAKKRAARVKMLKTKTIERGVVIVNTGPGKGKSTAAFGMVARNLGHGRRVGIVQFIKGAWHTGEKAFFDSYKDQVRIFTMGEGFTWETQDRQRDIKAAQAAWDKAQTLLVDETINLVVLDEINVVLRHGYLDFAPIRTAIEQRPTMQHVILTGRNAPEDLLELADTVTEMKPLKHAFRAGVKAQVGVEF